MEPAGILPKNAALPHSYHARVSPLFLRRISTSLGRRRNPSHVKVYRTSNVGWGWRERNEPGISSVRTAHPDQDSWEDVRGPREEYDSPLFSVHQSGNNS